MYSRSLSNSNNNHNNKDLRIIDKDYLKMAVK